MNRMNNNKTPDTSGSYTNMVKNGLPADARIPCYPNSRILEKQIN